MGMWNATRRRFLAGTVPLALGTRGAAACLSGPVPPAAQGDTATQVPAFHSRHIPEPWLNFETPMGRGVKRNGLCDTLQPDVLLRLKDQGVQLIETRLVWWELEAEAGRFFSSVG